jgi:hypothetical protein
MGIAPVLVTLIASSRISSLKPAMRAFLSGPWQRKQVSDMMGRISRLKLTGPFGSAARLRVTERAKVKNIGITLWSCERMIG